MKRERWGEQFIDKRNWKVYNSQLVKRGEFFLDFDFVKSWKKELDELNKGKVGRPFEFPNSLIRLQAVWHAFGVPFRMIEGMTCSLRKLAKLPDVNSYSDANRRINSLELTIPVPEGKFPFALFADGTGFQAIEGGEYLREKYGKKNRRWVQVVILGNPATKKPVSFEVNVIQSSEAVSAQKQLKPFFDRLKEFGGDGSFDKLELWKLLEENNIKSTIKPDENASEERDCFARNAAVRLRNDQGKEIWHETVGYGRRWPATEGIFSAVKRMFGEQLHARSEIGLTQEAGMKFFVYERLKSYGEN